ncbi:unnamed protein product [Amaranthus hypochondriacus]
MYKQSPSRNYRSKGIRVKHILQLCVLVAVCFWLLYQLKHSHEKRKEIESNDKKVAEKVQSAGEIRRLGRKDMPRITEIAKNGEKHEEDEEDEDSEEDENKHLDDESEREDSLEERISGDDEMYEREPDKTEEEEVDEEKERDENPAETEENEDTHEEEEENDESGKEDHTELEEHIDDDDRDLDSERSFDEALGVLHKADDASSEVAHNVQSFNQKTENVTMGHGREIYGKTNFEQEHGTKLSDNTDEYFKDVLLKDNVNSAASYATTKPKMSKVNGTKPGDSSVQNSTVTDRELSATVLPNRTQTLLDFNLSQNGTVEFKATVTDDKNQQETAENAVKIENVNTNTTSASNNKNATDTAEDNAVGDATQVMKSEDSGIGDTDEISVFRSNDGTDAIQHDPIDASDLNTLPEIQSEVHDTEDAVSE